MIRLKTKKEIEGIRQAGVLLAEILAELEHRVQRGVELAALDAFAEKSFRDADAEPAFLGYKPEGAARPYPASICASLNDVVVHGIPSKKALQEGDVLKIDLGVRYRGFVADAAISLCIGTPQERTTLLLAATKQALEAAIRACVPGKRLGDIGFAVETTVKRDGFSVIRGLTGHGVGLKLHEDPVVLNYGEQGTGLELKPGLVLALEPMVSAGSGEIREMSDGSFKTRDGSIAAHFEHTIAVTEEGPIVLTR